MRPTSLRDLSPRRSVTKSVTYYRSGASDSTIPHGPENLANHPHLLGYAAPVHRSNGGSIRFEGAAIMQMLSHRAPPARGDAAMRALFAGRKGVFIALLKWDLE